MASSENGDGSENVGSPGGLLPAASCFPYSPYLWVATAAPFAHLQVDIEVILKSTETAVLRLTRGIFPTELL